MKDTKHMTDMETEGQERGRTTRRGVLALGTVAAATTFMGTAWSEPTLLRLAYAYERASGVRRPPTYRAADVGF
ncbi:MULTISPECIES: hypothetical protein [unclassified Streptomyces]|uniref:hypothetical protein n=1 Tax=unclassified Streptomyces TaxID=2593676 RepID=UPI002258A7BB|nr:MULTISPECIES: hypothetical protein [unclassified Streptomyces]